MTKILDRIFCAILALGTLGHLMGTLKLFAFGTGLFVWSLSGALAAAGLTLFSLRSLRI